MEEVERDLKELIESLESSSKYRKSPLADESQIYSEDDDNRGYNTTYLKNPLIWIDLEMTGLDVEKHHILEIAVLITDGDLNVPQGNKELERGLEIVIHQPDEVLNDMNDWCKEQHKKSGLVGRSRMSKINLVEAEDKVVEFMQRYTQSMESGGLKEHHAHLAGSSVYVDRAFLRRWMPRVHAHLHWRLVDVSTLLELARRWFPIQFRKCPHKKLNHTAMSDIRESLKELKYYRKTIFRQQPCV